MAKSLGINFSGLLRVDVLLVDPCASKASFSSQGFIEVLDFQNFCGLNFFNDHLSDSVVFPVILIQ